MKIRHTHLLIIPFLGVCTILIMYLALMGIDGFFENRKTTNYAKKNTTNKTIEIQLTKKQIDQLIASGYHIGNGFYNGVLNGCEYIVRKKGAE